MRVTDRIAETIETIMEDKFLSGQFDYDVQIGIMPTENQQNLLIAQLFFFGKNPIFSEGDLVAIEIIPLEATKNDFAMRGLIDRCVELIRQQQSQALRLQ